MIGMADFQYTTRAWITWLSIGLQGTWFVEPDLNHMKRIC